MVYKCKNCGSALEYSAENNNMYCSYCGSSFSLEEVSQMAEGAEPPKEEKKILNRGAIFDFNNPNGFASNEFGDYNTILQRKQLS